MAQERGTTDSDGIRAGRPGGAARQPVGPVLSAAVARQLTTAQTAMTQQKWAEALPPAKAAFS